MELGTWMTTDEVASYLRCSPSHVRRELRKKNLRGVLLGQTYRIRRKWADDYLEGIAV